MDPLALVLIACLSALTISVVTAIAVAWQNRGSRNLVLTTGTFCGVALLFFTQLRFELQPTTANDFILTELGIDRAKPEIRQRVYSADSAAERPTAEVYASNWLSAHNPDAFIGNREKLTHDLVLFSLAYFLQTPEAQYWDVRKHSFVGKYSGGVVRFPTISAQRACTVVTPAEIASQFSHSGNLFAGAPLGIFSICLPPSSILEITAKSFTIRNHVCEVSFTIEPSGGVGFLSPRQGEELAKLPNGESRFETRTTGLDVKVTFFALRTGQRDSDKYRQWSSKLVSGVRDWFEK